jgi:hypothetical protein
MKRLKTDKRALPITCHHLVLAELLRYLPRVLAEMVEQYRLSLEDDFLVPGPKTMVVYHQCNIDDSMICPFEEIRTLIVEYSERKISVSVTLGSRLAEYYEFIPEPGLPYETNEAAIRAFVTRRRLPCDMLQDCIDSSKVRDHLSMRGLYIHPDQSVWEKGNSGWFKLYPNQVNRK